MWTSSIYTETFTFFDEAMKQKIWRKRKICIICYIEIENRNNTFWLWQVIYSFLFYYLLQNIYIIYIVAAASVCLHKIILKFPLAIPPPTKTNFQHTNESSIFLCCEKINFLTQINLKLFFSFFVISVPRYRPTRTPRYSYI